MIDEENKVEEFEIDYELSDNKEFDLELLNMELNMFEDDMLKESVIKKMSDLECDVDNKEDN